MRVLCLFVCAFIAIATAGTALAQDNAPAAEPGVPTYAKEVSRLVQAKCSSCHHPGGIGPFSLLTYRQTKGWGEMIKEVVSQRRMPPWHADPAVGKFKNDRRLTDQEIATIVTWIDGGRPMGNEADLPEPVKYSEDWRIPGPDAVFELPAEQTIAPSGVVPYREIEVPTNFTEDKWLQAIEARASNPKVVHHIIVFVRSPEMQVGERQDFQRLGRGFLVGFAPGVIPTVLQPGYAVKVPKGSSLIFQMHYTPTGKNETDRSQLGIVFAKEPPQHEVVTATTINGDFLIPAGDPNYQVIAESVIPDNAVLYSMTPHMHYRGKSFEYIAHYPDGKSETLLRVPNYDFNWQTSYILETPARLPKGTRIETIAHFDNSANNKANPDPTKPVRWGEQTWEEMMIGWMNISWENGPVQAASAGGGALGSGAR
jgi:mono/diheme cytochrome c family protein